MAKGRDGSGNHIKNSHLIGKGGGQVKKVGGSFVKGIPAKPQLKSQETRKELPKVKPLAAAKPHAKKIPPAVPKKESAAPAKKKLPPAATKAIQAKPKPAPKKAAPAKAKPKKGPTKGR